MTRDLQFGQTYPLREPFVEPTLFEVPGAPERVTAAMVAEVFDHWVDTMRATGRSARWQPVLDAKRERRIRRALKEHGMTTVRAAIEGCARSDFHMGQNKRGKRYDDISLILRDAEHIERFAEDADDDPF